MGQRKQFSSGYKAKVALEAIKGQRTAQEIGSVYGVHPTQVTTWKKTIAGGGTIRPTPQLNIWILKARACEAGQRGLVASPFGNSPTSSTGLLKTIENLF